jgi:hypothetical protein
MNYKNYFKQRLIEQLDEDLTTPERDRENTKSIYAAFKKRDDRALERAVVRDQRERSSPDLIGKGGKKVNLRRGVAYKNIDSAGRRTKSVLRPLA